MIIKEKSFYRKFIDWYDKWRHKMNTNHGTKIPGFWERGRAQSSLGSWLILCLVGFLAWYFDPVWRPFLHYYIPDFFPLLEYDPYTP